MAHESYTLHEVAELLGRDLPAVVRMVQEGAFPGRFLTAEFEMRVPVGDVRRVIEQRPVVRESQERALVATDADALRVALGTWWEEERQVLASVVGDLVQLRDADVETLRSEVASVREQLARLSEDVRRVLRVVDEGRSIEAEGFDASELDGLLAEVQALEETIGLPPLHD
jgi:hypothetical protein